MGTSALVQVIHILCDDGHIELVFEARYEFVSFVRHHTTQLLATFVVELLHQFGVTFVTLNACHCLYGILFSKATAVAEGADAALS